MADLGELSRQALAGLVTVPGEAMRLLGYVANPARVVRKFTGESTELDNSRYGEGYAPYNRLPQILEGTADAWNNKVADTLGVKRNPSLLDDTAEAGAKLLGQAVPAAPGAFLRGAAAAAPSLLSRAGQTLPGKIVGRTAELLTPTTLTPSLAPAKVIPRVAANVAAQGTLGTALEYNTEEHDPTATEFTYDAHGQMTDAYIPAPDQTPGAGRVAARAVGKLVSEHPVAAGLSGAALAGLAVLTHRGVRKANTIREATAASDVLGPLDKGAADVPIIANPVKDLVYRAGEVLADQHLRAKEGIDLEGTRLGKPADAQAAKDAIELAGESPHSSRLEALANDGIIMTPRGEKQTTSLRRLADSVRNEAQGDPEFVRKANEYVAFSNEINNRTFAQNAINRNKPGAKYVFLDKHTGEEATAKTDPNDVVRDVPRVNMWHVDTPTLIARRDAIANAPDGPRVKAVADQYWKYHNDIADASVDFGVVSKAERALWARANPEYMHTINLEQPKSPRTYRGRAHGAGSREVGDMMLAAGEYGDFMLNSMYHHRKMNTMYDILKDSKWLGKIADPEVMRRTLVQDPVTKALRPQKMSDINIGGRNVRSFYRNGELVHMEVLNPQFRHTMDKHPVIAQTMMGMLRGWAQSGMTGKLSLAVGQPFGLANLSMGAMFGPAARPAGRALGQLDSGKKGIIAGVTRTLDPTTYGGIALQGARDVKSVLHRAFADAMYNSIDVQGGLYKTANAIDRLSPAWLKPGDARTLASNAAKKYLDSALGDRARTGSGNSSTIGERDFDTPNGKMTQLDAVSPRYNQIRVVSDANDIKRLFQEFRRTVTPTHFKTGVRLLNDIQEAIGSAAQSHLYANNRAKGKQLDTQAQIPENLHAAEMAKAQPLLDRAAVFYRNGQAYRAAKNNVAAAAQFKQARQLKNQAQPFLAQAAIHERDFIQAREEWFRETQNLSLAARQLLGDSGAMGSGLAKRADNDATWVQKAVGATLNTVPYGNIGMQASARLLRAMREDPTGTAAAMATMIGVITSTTMGSAEWYDKVMGTSGTEGSAVKFDMNRPNWDQVRNIPVYIPGIPLENAPVIRADPLYQFGIGASREFMMKLLGWIGGPNEPLQAYSREQLLTMIDDRTHDLRRTALLNTLPINQLPPAIGAVIAMSGVESPNLESVISRGGVNLIPQRGLGGPDDTRLNQDIIGKRLEAAIQQIWGGAGTTAVEFFRQGHQGELANPGGFLPRAVDAAQGKAKDRLQELRPLWGQPGRTATNNFAAQAVNDKEKAIEAIRQNRASITAEGSLGTGRSRTLDPAGGGIQGVPDDLKPSLVRVARFATSVQSLRQERESIRQRLLSIDQRPNMDYAQRRVEQNKLAREVNRINGELLAHYTRFEDQESRATGVRFRLKDLDLTRGLDQFRNR